MFWTAVEPVVVEGAKQLFECTCGTRKMVNKSNVRSGKSTSCGCKGKPFVPKAVNRTFSLIKYRCNTKTSPDYPNWGGKGVKVLYKDAYELYKDIGDKPSDKHSIDRIDGKGHYEKGNCRWATPTEQANNQSSNVNLSYKGKTKSISMWAREIGISPSALSTRLAKGDSIEKALSRGFIKYEDRAHKVGATGEK